MNIHKVFLVFQKHFRKNRMKQFVELFNVTENIRILDIGGGIKLDIYKRKSSGSHA